MLVSVTTCKGRLVHLRRTLPQLVREVDHAIVVDWDCPDAAGDWAETLGERVTVVRPDTRGALWHKTRALNLGAWRAFELGARVLAFVDADTIVRPGFGELARTVGPGRFLIVPGRQSDLLGLLVVAFEDFNGVGGYDDRFVGYGREDLDLRLALAHAGASWRCVPRRLLEPIRHGHDLRARFQSEPKAESERRAEALMRRKWGQVSKNYRVLVGRGRTD